MLARWFGAFSILFIRIISLANVAFYVRFSITQKLRYRFRSDFRKLRYEFLQVTP